MALQGSTNGTPRCVVGAILSDVRPLDNTTGAHSPLFHSGPNVLGAVHNPENPMLSTECRALAHQAVRWAPERRRLETDSILALRALILAARAEALEAALVVAQQREDDARAIGAYLRRPARRCPTGRETRPIFAARPTPIDPRWAAALGVYGD